MTNDAQQVNLDKEVRWHVYNSVLEDGRIPTVAETASALSRGREEINASFQRLAEAHILVLQKSSGEILMANPFSAVPTPFLVETDRRTYYGNCIWDAMGVPAMLGQDARIETSCGCCGAAMNLEITNGRLGSGAAGVAHFAIPAARWWDDIVFN